MSQRSRTTGGRFTSGPPGGEDHVPQNPLEAWMNEFELVVDSGAATNTAQAAVEPTGLGVTKGAVGDKEVAHRRWTIYGGIFRPLGLEDMPAGAPASFAMKVQVQVGDQTVTPLMRDRTHPLVVCEGLLNFWLLTSGGGELVWPKPMDIVHPFPLYAEELTVVVDAESNLASVQNCEWLVTLYYAVAEGRMQDQLQYLQMLQHS